MNKFNFILLLLTLSGCYLQEEIPVDQNVWQYGQPNESGLSDDVLLKLNADIDSSEYGLIDGLIIIKDDKLVFENYYTNGNRNTLKTIDRASFSVAIMLFDQFIEKGLIGSIDDPIYQYLPQYEPLFEKDTSKKEITFNHIFNHKTGLIWNETSDLSLMRNTADWTGYILANQLESAPGSRTSINDRSGIILATIYQNLLTSEPLIDFIDNNLFSLIDIDDFHVEETPEGSLNLSRGISLSTFDYTKLSYLILQEGRWGDRNRVVQREWILDIVSLKTQFSPNYGIGLGWWVFSDSFIDRYIPQAEDCIFISGGSGDNLYLLPSLNMIVCVTADNYYDRSIYNSSLRILIETLKITSSESNGQ